MSAAYRAGRPAGRGPAAAARLAPGGGVEPRPKYLFLDGLRGLAALYVVFHHAACELFGEPFPAGIRTATTYLLPPLWATGHWAVSVFIVLSGFCLMLPVARDPGGRLRGGVPGYLFRRARRILPPYYAALGLTLALCAAVPLMTEMTGGRWDIAQPVFDKKSIWRHLMLIHNWSPAWLLKISPPFWTIAVEWQLYLLFPLLVVLHRRIGPVPLIVASSVVASVLTQPTWLGWSYPWMLTLFVMGMTAAAATEAAPHTRLGISADAGVLMFVVLFSPLPIPVLRDDLYVGAGTAWLLWRMARPTDGRSLLQRTCESAPMLWLGRFSYSLYLTHFPLLSLANMLLKNHGVSPGTRLGVMLFGGTAGCVLFAWVFYLVFEKWTHPKAKVRPAAEPAGEDPATLPMLPPAAEPLRKAG